MDAVRTHCPVEPVHWIASDLNASDILTRGNAHPNDLGITSVWQNGPDFFTLPRDAWPISRNFIEDVKLKIPKEETVSTQDYLQVALLKSNIMPREVCNSASDFLRIAIVKSKVKVDGQPKLFAAETKFLVKAMIMSHAKGF